MSDEKRKCKECESAEVFSFFALVLGVACVIACFVLFRHIENSEARTLRRLDALNRDVWELEKSHESQDKWRHR